MALRSRIADEQPSSLGGWLFADLFLLMMVIGLAGFNITASPGAPRAITGEAIDITKSNAKINGVIDSGDNEATGFFRWGTSASLDSNDHRINAKESPILAKTEGLDVSAQLTGLTPDTNYYFQFFAESDAGSNNGKVKTFRTAKTTDIAPCSTANLFISTPFKMLYTELSARKSLSKDIQKWLTSNAPEVEVPRVVVALVRGWTTNPSGTDGSARARVFFDSVMKKNKYFNPDTALEALQNQIIPRGSFSVQLYFVEAARAC